MDDSMALPALIDAARDIVTGTQADKDLRDSAKAFLMWLFDTWDKGDGERPVGEPGEGDDPHPQNGGD